MTPVTPQTLVAKIRGHLDDATNRHVTDDMILDTARQLGDDWHRSWFVRGLVNLLRYNYSPA